MKGSSPHTRDKFVNYAAVEDKSRIIPAYAGQIDFSNGGLIQNKDHPRIRGTNQ